MSISFPSYFLTLLPTRQHAYSQQNTTILGCYKVSRNSVPSSTSERLEPLSVHRCQFLFGEEVPKVSAKILIPRVCWPQKKEKDLREGKDPHTVNQGPVSYNYQVINDKHVFLYSNSNVQTQKATVIEISLMFLYWKLFRYKSHYYSLKFQIPNSTDLMTQLEIHRCYF